MASPLGLNTRAGCFISAADDAGDGEQQACNGQDDEGGLEDQRADRETEGNAVKNSSDRHAQYSSAGRFRTHIVDIMQALA